MQREVQRKPGIRSKESSQNGVTQNTLLPTVISWDNMCEMWLPGKLIKDSITKILLSVAY